MMASATSLLMLLMAVSQADLEPAAGLAAEPTRRIYTHLLDPREHPDLIVSLHRMPENNFTWEQTHASFVATLRDLCEQAATGEITVHLRLSDKVMPELAAMIALVSEIGAPNLRLAPSLALLLDSAPAVWAAAYQEVLHTPPLK